MRIHVLLILVSVVVQTLAHTKGSFVLYSMLDYINDPNPATFKLLKWKSLNQLEDLENCDYERLCA